MDGFGDSFVPPAEAPAEVDPAAEFLAREQDQLAGLDDDILPAAPTSQPADLVDETDLFGAPVTGGSGLDSFEMLAGEEVGPGVIGEAAAVDSAPEEPTAPAPAHDSPLEGDLSGFGADLGAPSLPADDSTGDGVGDQAAPEETSVPAPARSPVPPVVREEPEKIKLWREQQRVRLEEKDAAEEVSKEELQLKAQKELEDWYKQHEEQVAKTRQANRSAEKELVADIGKMEPGTEWERIAKLCNFNPKTSKSSRDISRMRSIILQVKQNPPVKA